MNHTIEKHIETGPTRFMPVTKRIPKAGIEVVGYKRTWINDKNSRGTRMCFIHPEAGLWVSAVWTGFEFYTEHGSNPTHWKSTGKLPDEDIDGNAIPNPDWNNPEQDHQTTYEDVKYLLPSMDDLPADVIGELKWLASIFPGAYDKLFSWGDEDNQDCPALANWVLDQFGLTKFFIDMREFLPDDE